MLLFCPTCGNVLVAEEGSSNNSSYRFSCHTCPYVHNIHRKITARKYPKMKEVDDVLGGEDAWKNVQTIDEKCPNCSHPKAYFLQLQTRSADEPATLFYKCCSVTCGHRWRE